MGALVPKNLGDDTECNQLYHQGRPDRNWNFFLRICDLNPLERKMVLGHLSDSFMANFLIDLLQGIFCS